MTGRGLTPAERDLAQRVFGASIAYEHVRLVCGKWWFLQPRNIVMAPRGHIHFHPDGPHYCADFCQQGLSEQGLFIHEMTHVWQHQQGINLLWRRHPFSSYRYRLVPGKFFDRYGIEQQAEIVRHAFLLRQGAALPHLPPLPDYEAILPFAMA